MQVQSSLQEVFQKEIQDPMTGRVGIHVLDLDTGEEVISHSADQTFFLASLTKIFTVGAAFQVLGGDTRFTTRFTSECPVAANGVLDGDLFISGGGDPTIGNDKHIKGKFKGNGTSIGRIAHTLRASGVERVTGSLVADGSLFSPEEQLRTNWMGALSYSRTKFAAPVAESAQAISDELWTEGLKVEGRAREGTLAPESAHDVASVDSPTVRDLAIHAGHESDNFVSEILTKHLGARFSANGVGTSTGGCKVIEGHAATMGATIDLWNGSGLVRQVGNEVTSNEATPRQVTNYLQSLHHHDLKNEVLASMPRAAEDGTLKDRMRNSPAVGNVRAKTGTLVHRPTRKPLQDSLAGYCHADGKTLAFAVIYERAETRYAARTSLDRGISALATSTNDHSSSL